MARFGTDDVGKLYAVTFRWGGGPRSVTLNGRLVEVADGSRGDVYIFVPWSVRHAETGREATLEPPGADRLAVEESHIDEVQLVE